MHAQKATRFLVFLEHSLRQTVMLKSSGHRLLLLGKGADHERIHSPIDGPWQMILLTLKTHVLLEASVTR